MTTAAPSVRAEELTCKGTTIKAALAFIDERGFVGARQRILSRMPEESRTLVSGMVLPSSRLPLSTLVDLCEATDAVIGRGDLQLCWDIGGFAADYEVNLLHKAFLMVASLDFWFRAAGSTWTLYYGRGRLTPESMGKMSGTLRLSEFDPISKAFCYRFGGWVRRVVEMSRMKNVRLTHPECVLDGHASCVWQGTWAS